MQSKVLLHFEEYCSDRHRPGTGAGTMDSLMVHPLNDPGIPDDGGDGADLCLQNLSRHLLRVPPKKGPRPLNQL